MRLVGMFSFTPGTISTNTDQPSKTDPSEASGSISSFPPSPLFERERYANNKSPSVDHRGETSPDHSRNNMNRRIVSWAGDSANENYDSRSPSRLRMGSVSPRRVKFAPLSPKHSDPRQNVPNSLEAGNEILHSPVIERGLSQNNNPHHSNPNFSTGISVMEQIGEPDYSGWLCKKSDRQGARELRYLVLKGQHLYSFRSRWVRGVLSMTET
jgi:hypothetical protein